MGEPTGEGVRIVGGRYRLIDRVGSGGMGTVWRAHDELLGRTVAVKEVDLPLLVGIDRAQFRSRTLREARAAARLSHPNAVTIHDVVDEDGQLWIVMQLVDSESLLERIQTRGVLPPRQVAEIGLAVLGALDAAHAAGILHRDVKPANVLLGHDGRIVLTDFGVATLEGDPALTGSGMMLGSPAYMAPECARGLAAGPHSDLWSLGATMFAAIEGRSPFERGGALATLAALASEEPPAPRSAGPLTPVLVSLLQRDPKRRLDATGARQLLLKALGHRPGNMEPAPDPHSGDKPLATKLLRRPRIARRLPRGVLLSGLAVVAAGVLAATILIATNRDDPTSPRRATASSSPTQPATEPTPSTRPAGSLPPVPAGFKRYIHPSGWSVGIPADWAAQEDIGDQQNTYGVDTYVRLIIEHATDLSCDPLALLQGRESFAQETNGKGYTKNFLRPVDYRGYLTADWDYTVDTTTLPVAYHQRTRAMAVGERCYVITLVSRTGQWNASLKYFTVATDTFQPA